MLKAIVNYSKKIPAEEQYSSQGYSLSLETEIPETDPAAIQARLSDTFALVRDQVEHELANGNGTGSTKREADGKTSGQFPTHSRTKGVGKASNAQVKYATDLWTAAGGPISDLNARIRQDYGVQGLYDLDKKQASDLLNQLKKETKKAA